MADQTKQTGLEFFKSLRQGGGIFGRTDPQQLELKQATQPDPNFELELDPSATVHLDSKEKDTRPVIEKDGNRFVLDKGYWVPWNVTSFADLALAEQAEEMRSKASMWTYNLQQMVENIVYTDDIDQRAALNSLVNEYSDLIDTLNINGSASKEADETKEDPKNNNSWMLWKEEGSDRQRWLAVYSNNYQDVEGDIITEKSHETFVKMVDDGLIPYPELWHWHIPGTRWGQADWVAYSDGFSLASGLVDVGKEAEAETLEGMGPMKVSHGMPRNLLVRDPVNPNEIVFHVTREISPLPDGKEANDLTGFLISKEQDHMSLPKEKIEHLGILGYSSAQIDGIQSALKAVGTAADDSGRTSKEASGAVAADQADATPAKEAADVDATANTEESTDAQKSKDIDTDPLALLRKEVAETLTSVMDPVLEAIPALAKQVGELTATVASMQQDDASKVATKAAETPTLSLKELVEQQMFGTDSAAVIDGRKSLAQDKPKEAPTDAPPLTPIPFINKAISDQVPAS